MDELERVDAPGLPADWLNGWLAAIGVTVLLPTVKLSWTDSVVPHAVFWCMGREPLAQQISRGLPDAPMLARAVIARLHPEAELEFPRSVSLESFQERAEMERGSGSWLLAASVSDLLTDLDEDSLRHSPFDPTAPRGETLGSRALRCRDLIGDDAAEIARKVEATLLGTSQRVKANGLGFDCRRLVPGAVVGGAVQVDPVVELLALHALRLFPFRGNGRVLRQRGFADAPTRRGAFRWHAWGDPMDSWAIDASMDFREPSNPGWQLVPYSVPPPDNTRAYFSEPVS